MCSCICKYTLRMQAVARAAAIPLEPLPVGCFETSSIIWSRSAKTGSESRLLYFQDFSFSSITVMVIRFGLSFFFCKAAGLWMLQRNCSCSKPPRQMCALGKILHSCNLSSCNSDVYIHLTQTKQESSHDHCVVVQPG